MPSDFRSVHWCDKDALLKNYKAETRARGGAVVKIELEVFDPGCLGFMLQELAEIKRDQGKQQLEATIILDDEPISTSRRVTTNARGQMLLTHRGPAKP